MISEKGVVDLIKELNLVDETESLEAKEASNSPGRSVFETICAMSNEPDLAGGTILLGVGREEDLFPYYSATGVSDPDRTAAEIASGCASMFNGPVRVDISTHMIGDARVIRIDVPELASHQKPLYFESQGLPKGAFRRVGSTDVRCTEEDLLTFYQGKENMAFDGHVVDEATLDDIDPGAVVAYRTARKATNPFAEELFWTDEDLLYALGAVRRLDGKSRVTATGILVFGRAVAIRRLFPIHRIDYIRVPGRKWVQDPEKRFESVDLRGPLMTVINRVIAAIADDLPRAFRLSEGENQRTEIPILPGRVLREAVVNALMHRSFQVFQPIQIIRYSNRLVIKNPGYSLKSEERFDDPGSVSRNPRIAEILHDTGFAENKGSGIRVMRQLLADSGLSEPTFDSDRATDTFTAIFLFHHFLNEDDWKWLAQFAQFDLSDDQKRALIFLREAGAIDNSTYRSLTQTDTLTASKSLRKMRTLELVVARGSSAKTHYEPGPQMISRLAMDIPLEPSSQGSKDNSQDSRVTLADVPTELRALVNSFGLGRRLPAEQVERLILGLCRWQPLSSAELGRLLGKSVPYLQQAYLNGMVKDGKLDFLHPETNHPSQKYTARSTG